MSSRPLPESLLALAGLAALVAFACQEGSDPQFTPVPASTFDPAPGPPTAFDSTTPDAAGDGGEGDGGAADGGDAVDGGSDGDVGDGSPDASVDAAPDVAPDAAAEPMCLDDQDCVLAVRLTTCDPCPVAAHVDDVLADRCLVVFVQGATIGTYAPADCWAECGDAIGEACFDGPAAAVCDPPRMAGTCTLFR